MRTKNVIIISILFFLLVNTSYFIEKLSGLWDFLVAVIILLGFIALGIIFLGQLYTLIKEKASDKSRITSTLVLLVALIVTSLFPTGIINYEDLQGEDLLIANREGAANCQTVIKIKKNGKFIQTSLCFGIDKWAGTHQLVGDTVKFKYSDTVDLKSKFAYGLIKLTENKKFIKIGQIFLYENYSDTIALPMTLTYFDDM